jgi:hypothetical protein
MTRFASYKSRIHFEMGNQNGSRLSVCYRRRRGAVVVFAASGPARGRPASLAHKVLRKIR